MNPDKNNHTGDRATFTATDDQAERRIDRVLRGLYPDVPLGAIMKAIRKRAVRLNGAKVVGNERLAVGDVVTVPWGAAERRQTTRPTTATGDSAGKSLVTIFRNDDLWLIDKPTGLLSQPDKKGGDSVVTRVWEALAWERDDFRPAALHRLDRNVSGVMAIALRAPILRILSELLREGAVGKTYRAIVRGTPPQAGEIALSLLKDPESNTVRVDQAGKPSLTRYRTLRSNGLFSLVELDLVTGRPHQARVHLASLGHPILGDGKYGGSTLGQGRNERLFLHAYALSFPDTPKLPTQIRGMFVKSELPKEFADLMA